MLHAKFHLSGSFPMAVSLITNPYYIYVVEEEPCISPGGKLSPHAKFLLLNALPVARNQMETDTHFQLYLLDYTTKS